MQAGRSVPYNAPVADTATGGFVLRVTDFDYHLPEELIAQTPAEPRDASRLMVLSRADDSVRHMMFRDLPGLLRPGDCLVLNDSRVLPARLSGRRPAGGKAEVLLLRPLGGDLWTALVKPARRLCPGTAIRFGDGAPALEAAVVERREGGEAVLRLQPTPAAAAGLTVEQLIHRLGEPPLPPYIRSRLDDPERYQTVYARVEGSVAAPTAGLHFTPHLLERIRAGGVSIAWVTLHVGPGTFRPVTAETVEEHRMHPEYYELPPGEAAVINAARKAGGRVVAVGTTAARTLETCAGEGGVRPGRGWTSLFIYPGHRFTAIDGLLTNFHLPRSTLLMLVSAFAGRERVLAAYAEAVRCGYRFFSFGDAMLIL